LEITVVIDFDKGQARVLLMISAQSAVIGTAPLYRRVVCHWHFRGLEKNFSAAPVVVNIIRNEYSLAAVNGASLEQVDLALLKDDLSFYFGVAGRANGKSYVVEDVRSHPSCHELAP
jgi:hypothetical protein